MSLRLRNPLKMLRSNAIALDMGSGQTRIASPEGEMLLNEPTVVALEHGGISVLVTGTEAKSYLGKAPERIRVVRPVEAGAVVDFEAARELLRRFLANVLPSDGTRIKACVVVAQGLTELEKRTLADCCKGAGIGQVDLVSAPLAAAVGAGVDITQPKGRLLLGIGNGLAEASVVCLSDVVHSETIRCGAQSFHDALTRHLAEHQQITIGENMAEQATLQLACVAQPAGPRTLTLTGKFAATGSPCALELTHADLAGALDAPLVELEALVRSVMEHAPAELVADIGETGLLLYGGGAQLCGLDRFLGERLKLRITVAQDPQLASLRGATAALRPDLGFRKLLVR
jgi:rod shape-determining protein MreB